MTKAQEIQIKQSERRERINALLGADARTEAETVELRELTTAQQSGEVELRAALVLDSPPTVEVDGNGRPVDPEVRERLELRGRASFGGFLLAAMQGRVPAGAEHEYAAACGAQPGAVPMDLWEADRPAVETRQREGRAATPAPATGTGITVAPVQPFIFAPRLGIDMPSVGSGGYSELTITTALPAGARAKGANASDAAGVLTPLTANPRRISARMTVTLEDVAQIGQANFEAALRANVSMALSDEYDNQAINGDGTAPAVEGLIDQLTNPADPTAVAGFDDFVAAFADAIDGLWASTPGEVGIVANVDAYRLSAKTFRDGSGGQSRAGEWAFSDYAREHYGGWWTNKRMPATDTMVASGIVYRMGRMGLRTACHPTWGTVAIDDIFTDSRSGQRHFSVHALVGDKVLIVQPAAYSLVEFKVA